MAAALPARRLAGILITAGLRYRQPFIGRPTGRDAAAECSECPAGRDALLLNAPGAQPAETPLLNAPSDPC